MMLVRKHKVISINEQTTFVTESFGDFQITLFMRSHSKPYLVGVMKFVFGMSLPVVKSTAIISDM